MSSVGFLVVFEKLRSYWRGPVFLRNHVLWGKKGSSLSSFLEKPFKKIAISTNVLHSQLQPHNPKERVKNVASLQTLPKIRKMSKQFEPTIFYNHQEPFLREAVWSQGSVLICVAQMESTQQIRQSLRDSTICNGVFFSWSFQSSGFSALRRWDACNIRQDIAMSFRLFVGLT